VLSRVLHMYCAYALIPLAKYCCSVLSLKYPGPEVPVSANNLAPWRLGSSIAPIAEQILLGE
jgi:hypothetical protein